ncbi:VOC family protein [Planosporangium mesophilum]|nr:VOC family protein [Planosporangium mesophilum]
MTIDCAEPNAMADFYAALLDGKVTRRTHDSAFVDGAGMLLVFRAVPDYKPPTWPSPEIPMQKHFEFVVSDPDAAAEKLLPLGAKIAEYQDEDDPNFVVLLDPAGHPFCLIRSSAARRY